MPEQEAFYDAVYGDPDLPADKKAAWLHSCAADYDLRLTVIGEIVAGRVTPQQARAMLAEWQRTERGGS